MLNNLLHGTTNNMNAPRTLMVVRDLQTYQVGTAILTAPSQLATPARSVLSGPPSLTRAVSLVLLRFSSLSQPSWKHPPIEQRGQALLKEREADADEMGIVPIYLQIYENPTTMATLAVIVPPD